MTKPPSAAERVDRAVDGILDGLTPEIAAAAAGADAGTRGLLTLAAELRTTLVPPPVGERYEARLAARLASDPVARARRHPGRLIVTGAVGSAVGVGVTAYAVWRSTRRTSAAHRLLHR